MCSAPMPHLHPLSHGLGFSMMNIILGRPDFSSALLSRHTSRVFAMKASSWAVGWGFLSKLACGVTPDFLATETVSLPSHTFTETHLLRRHRPARQKRVCGVLKMVAFFYRTQHIPRECGHGPNPENNGGPAESMHGVRGVIIPLIPLTTSLQGFTHLHM